ncbi:hypothetical protein WJX72_000330 [[Myrmecia] bisecta]|uniref:GST C-terminal domain-containing protein n=1 Tax=[Myrmecia] bisecta TaxID=41462 RepID=A0AAW1QNX2_9CHLO
MAAGQYKARTALHEMAADGAFKRTDATFREWIKPGGRFPPEANRYHLYIAYGCPWASRCLAVRNMKGLEDVIGLSVTHPTWQRTRPDDPEDTHTGWTFASPADPPFSSPAGQGSFPTDDCIPDTVNNVKYVRDLYELAGDTAGKYTVPVLWDKKEKTIVNNESAEILRIFNSAFNDFAKNPGLDLYPEELRKQIDEVNDWVYPTINNGVYRCGFATKQAAYDEAFKQLFASLDRAEDILSKHRYLVGDRLTEADIRLFKTLIRFDEVYVVYFKTNKKFIHEYPNLKNFVREIYQHPGVKESVNIAHIKMHYFTAHPDLNKYAIIPKGGDAWWEEPHDRDHFNAKA